MAVRLNLTLDLILPSHDYVANPGRVADMKQSIQEHGLKTPLKVRLAPLHPDEPIMYVVVDGNIRLHALHLLGQAYAPCSVVVDIHAPDPRPIPLPAFLKRSEGVSA